ncbi:flavodoxin [Levilactobacillus cerevisiae]|uniref:flavodoxin n=1 Tax=Levilactobacillus cerevisiae TaxID=1704076 RepID=UPI000F7B3D4B|nr:flavodoxin [Levilactobacillus cerevisiae]
MGQSVVLYFSNTGHTQAIAERIAVATRSELVGIHSKVDYTAAELDWEDPANQAEHGLHAGEVRPAIEAIDPAPIVAAQTVYLGFPLWWATVPGEINTFLDSVDLVGKDVYPFCTSGITAIAEAVKQLREHYPDVRWHAGRRFSSSLTSEEIRDWVSED